MQSKREKTELVLKNVFNLPSVPRIMVEALKGLERQSISTSELNKIISKDQGLVSKILAIANSPMYGLQRKVTSLDYALLILGFSELKSIISVLSMTEAFKNKTDNYLNQKDFWLHSFLAGSAAKRIAQDIGFHNSGEAFIGGFLHDMGVTVTHRYLHSNYILIHEMTEKLNINQLEAETEVLGMNHQEIGFYLLEKWNFPAGLCNAVLYHHSPSDASPDDRLLTSIIHFADYMTKALQLGYFRCDKQLEFDKSLVPVRRLKTDEDIQNFIEGYRPLFTEQINSVRF